VDNPAYFEVVEQYRGALDTFFDYVDILNDNELNEKNLSSLFSEKFSISMIGNPNLTFQNISDFTKSWNAIRNETYSFICSPEKFSELKFAKISIQPLRDNSVMLALLDVFYFSADHIPQYKMCFIYTLLFDENEEIWLMSNLIELLPKNYPENWLEVNVPNNYLYDGSVPIEELKPLLASKLASGEKSN
tara:strand:- start:20882 stop:21451 length:570 start_codon:yes stop_codon:yes gene_type:complete